jgi:hypothetical protein
MKFTVVSLPSVDDQQIELWLSASDRKAVSDAANWIERQLKNDPLTMVTAVDDVYFIRRNPPVALCRISVDDRLVTIIDIRRVDDNKPE